MSIRLMAKVWDVVFPTQAQKLIALKIADYANDAGSSIYPARNTIAEKVGCGVSTVKNTLRAFRDVGLLVVEHEGGSGAKDTTRYVFNLSLLDQLACNEFHLSGTKNSLLINKGSLSTPLSEEGVTLEPIRGHSGTDKGSPRYPQSTKNHQEPSEQFCNNNFEDKKFISRAAIKVKRAQNASAFDCWIALLKDRGRDDLAEAAQMAGELTATTRWPTADSPLPKVNRSRAIEARKQGEHVA